MVWLEPILADSTDSIIEVGVILFFIVIGVISAAVKKAQAAAEQKRMRERWAEQDRQRGERPRPVAPPHELERRQAPPPRPTPPPPPTQKPGWQVVELTADDRVSLEQARQQAQQGERVTELQARRVQARRAEELRRRQRQAAPHTRVENERLVDHHLAESHVASARFRGSAAGSGSEGAKGIRVNLSDPTIARNAILFQEILGQPKALRDPDDEPWNR